MRNQEIELDRKFYVLLTTSAVFTFILLVTLEPFKDIIVGFLVGYTYLLIVQCMKERGRTFSKLKKNHVQNVIGFAVEAVLFVLFCVRWRSENIMKLIADALHIPKSIFVHLVAAGLAVISMVFVQTAMFCWKQIYEHKEKREFDTMIHDKKAVIICVLTALGVITVCSKSSFLYPLNDWVDANCFFTVGKSIANGKVVYRDLLEQKGPLLYFVHAIAYLISNDSFIGVYFFEVLAAAIFLYYSYQSFGLLINRNTQNIIPAMAFLVYTSNAFAHGDSAEELCLPFIAYTMYIVLKACKENKELSIKQYFIVGICSGCVFWTKFTLVGFYLGWFILPAFSMITKRRWKELGKSVLAILLGVIMATIPWILYFGMHGAIGDWLEVYIYDNIFLYGAKSQDGVNSSLTTMLILGTKNMFKNNIVIFVLILYGLLMLLDKRSRKSSIGYVLTVFTTFLFVYVGGSAYSYYSFVFSVFVPFGLAAIYDSILFFKKNVKKISGGRCNTYILIVLVVVLTGILTPNRYMLGENPENMPQYQFEKIISQEQNPTLLNYGFLDGGFYTVCNIVPNCKAFCKLNNSLEEMYALQEYYAEEGLCDFIVTRNRTVEFDKYVCVAESQYPIRKEIYTYYLYKLKE